MNKKITNRVGWFYLALGCVIISIGSLFLPIFKCNGGTKGKVLYFNIIDLIAQDADFNKYVINNYYGPIVWNIDSGIVMILSLVMIAALICAVVGLVTLRVQRPNTSNFVLTIIGLIGILVPSVTAIICVVVFGRYFTGGLSLGIAPILSPIAIIISIGAVVRRKNKAAEELQAKVMEKGLMRSGGDL